MMKILIVQPHSDDAILSCSYFLFSEGFNTHVLTIENNEKRIKEDKKLYEFIGKRYHQCDIDILDDNYSEFFETYGKNAQLTDDNVIEFYERKYGNRFAEYKNAICKEVKKYIDKGFAIVCPMGVGHPFHYLVRHFLQSFEKDFIFYREFPHSYKKKAKQQYTDTLDDLEELTTFSDDDILRLKFEIAEKFYKSQSAFFFYEKGRIEKYHKEEFFTKKSIAKETSGERHMDIYVISKGRPNGKTFKYLREGNIKYTVVVEPQDYEKYKEVGHENIEVLPENDRGFSYVMNYTKSKYDEVNPLMIIDDDVTSLFFNIEGTERLGLSLKTPEEYHKFFKDLEQEVLNTEFDIGTIGKSAFDYKISNLTPQIANLTTKKIYSNVCVTTIINNPKLKKIDYDENLPLKSDYDFSLKCMYLGFTLARFTRFCQQTKMNKDCKQSGGLQETYRKPELLQKAVDIMCERWGDNVYVADWKKDINGIKDIKVRWKAFIPVPAVIKEIKEKLT